MIPKECKCLADLPAASRHAAQAGVDFRWDGDR